MDSFVLQQWEEVGERIKQDDFVPLQIEVTKKTEVFSGLIQEQFEEPIEYALGPRAHTSVAATRAEQQRKLKLEKELSEQIILTQAQIDQMVEEAYNRGKEETLSEAVNSNNERITNMEQSLKTVLDDLVSQEQASIEDLERNALKLTLEISEKIIEHAVEINPEYILSIIKEALNLSGGARIKRVKVSPQDMEFIEVMKVSQSIKEFDGTWNFEADETIKAGCILESSAGAISFDLVKSWEKIRDKVLSIKR